MQKTYYVKARYNQIESGVYTFITEGEGLLNGDMEDWIVKINNVLINQEESFPVLPPYIFHIHL